MTDKDVAVKKENKLSEKVTKLVDQISELSVLDLSELVKALQEKLGVTPQAVAAAPATGQAATAATNGAAPAESAAQQTVILTSAGANKINVIKALREINQNLTLMDAKGMTETVPAEVLKDAKAEDAKAASDKLKAAGATVELK